MNKKVIFFIVAFFLLSTTFSLAQTKSFQRTALAGARAVVEVVRTNLRTRKLFVRVEQEDVVGSYKQAWCYVDEFTEITKEGSRTSRLKLKDIQRGDQIYVEAEIFNAGVKECRKIKILKKKW